MRPSNSGKNMMLNLLPELKEISRISGWLARWQWSEAAGGNFSIRLDDIPLKLKDLPEGPPQSLPLATPKLSESYLLVSGSGTRARDIAEDPAAGVGLYRVLPGGQSYIWLAGNNRPTSELPSHLAIHHALLDARPAHRAVVHTHPPNIISLTHLPEFQDGHQLSDTLFRMQSEARLILPEGAALLPYHLPGSLELGLASAEAVCHHFVVLWRMHGALATGQTLSQAVDYLEVVDKAARIYWTVVGAGRKPIGMSDEDIQTSLKKFGRWERFKRD